MLEIIHKYKLGSAIVHKILTVEKVETKCNCEYIKNTVQANT